MTGTPEDPQDRLLRRFGPDAKPTPPAAKNFSYHQEIGVMSRFRNTQEVRTAIVGDKGPEHVAIETWDSKEGPPLSLKFHLLIAGQQLVGVMDGLLAAEAKEAVLAATPMDEQPEMPILVAEVPGCMGSVSIFLDRYNGRLRVKLSRAVPGRSSFGEWLILGLEDIHTIGSLLFKAYEAIPTSPAAAPSAPVPEMDVPF